MRRSRCCLVIVCALTISLLVARSSADGKEERKLSDEQRVAIGSIISGQRSRPWRYGRRSWNPSTGQEYSLYNAKVADLLRQRAAEQNEYENYIKSLVSNNIPLKPMAWEED